MMCLVVILIASQVMPVSENKSKAVNSWESALQNCGNELNFVVEKLKSYCMALSKDDGEIGVWCVGFNLGNDFTEHSSIKLWEMADIWSKKGVGEFVGRRRAFAKVACEPNSLHSADVRT